MSTAAYPVPDGAPGRTRTCNPRLRRPVLCPVELRAQRLPTLPVPSVVGVEGFEPPTHCSQSNCATRLRYTPTGSEPINCRNFTALQQTGLAISESRNKKAPTTALSGLTTEMARPERFELPTFWFVARHSIQLSYRRVEAAHSRGAPPLESSRPARPKRLRRSNRGRDLSNSLVAARRSGSQSLRRAGHK